MRMLIPHLWPLTAVIDSCGHLCVGGCDLRVLAEAYGTPLYVLDETTVRESCRAYRAAALRGYAGTSRIHYASKALLTRALAQLVAAEGLGLDVVSGGELYVALQAGIDPALIHVHGNAKPRAELAQALAAGVGCIVVDTLDEMEVLAQLTREREVAQPIMLRLAPDIAVDTHTHIETGRATSKFGLPLDALEVAAERIIAAPGLCLMGLHAHLGSQLFAVVPIERAIGVLLDGAGRLRDRYGVTIAAISPGGGLGVPYTADQPLPDVVAYLRAIGQALEAGCAARGLPLPQLVLEPGRSIVARAGVALYQVVATKATIGFPRYLHVDGGMADNIRPALYGARYTALLANRAAAPAEETVHVAGRYCESGDLLLRDIALPRAAPGDLLALATAGAYTLSMSSTYNLVPRPALVLVGDGQARVMQRRESYADLLARDEPLH